MIAPHVNQSVRKNKNQSIERMNRTHASQSNVPTGAPRGQAIRFLLLLAMMTGLAANQASAATVTIYTNDFESYSAVATGWDDTADADPVGTEWQVRDDTALNPTTPGMGVQVINWKARSGNKALLLRSSSEAEINFPGPRSGSRYQLDFWLWVEKGTTGDRNFYFILRGEGADFNGDDYLAYRSDRGTSYTIWNYDGVANNNAGLWVNTGQTHTEGGWQHHRLVIRANELKMDLYLDDMDTPKVTNLDLARCEVAVPVMLRILHEGNSADDGFFVLDDISLTVDDSVDLSTTFTEGFESYAARTNPNDDADPAGPWITVETDGTGTGRALAPGKIQVVDSTVVTPRSGNKCLKLEGGQRAGVSIAWGVPPMTDVEITWWARVPEAFQSSPTADANLVRMSLYGAENMTNFAGDNALLGYGIRRQSNTNCGYATALLYYHPTAAWQQTGYDFTPNVWEQYRLTTHVAQGRYTIIKNPDSPNPTVVVDRAPFIGSGITNWAPVFMAGWSSSNGTNHPPVYVDDIQIRTLVSVADPLGDPYSITNHGTRFTNVTVLTVPGQPVGRPAVDPRDQTILVALDATAGGIYRLQKVASGNWVVHPTPIVSGLDRPSGLAVETNGTIWWTHDYNNAYTSSVARLKWPWSANQPETVVADILDPSPTETDDDAIDLCIAPSTFNGSIGRPGWIVVADRGVNGNARNGVYLIDPNTTELNQTNTPTFLVQPTAGDLGGDLMAIDALPQSGEVVVVSIDGFLVAINAEGAQRYINALNLWPLGGPASAAAIAVDPLTGHIWAADDQRDEIWSINSSTGEDRLEISFLPSNPSRPEQQIDIHDPGMVFAPDGSFLVVSDTSTVNGGGRLLIFHNEPFAIPNFAITGGARTPQGVTVTWSPAGAVKYSIQRGTDVADPASFTVIATNLPLSTLSFTDTNPPPTAAFYRVVATPDPLTKTQ